MSVHLLLAERRHVLDLLVVALHPLLVLGYLLGIKQLVGRRVLKWKKEKIKKKPTYFSHEMVLTIYRGRQPFHSLSGAASEAPAVLGDKSRLSGTRWKHLIFMSD